MSKTANKIDQRPPRLFVRLKTADRRTLCLLPIGIGMEDVGHGRTQVTQFGAGVKVGVWTVLGETNDLADQFEAAADAMRTQMLLEAARPASVEEMLKRLVAREMEDYVAAMSKALDQYVGPAVEKKLTSMARKADKATAAK